MYIRNLAHVPLLAAHSWASSLFSFFLSSWGVFLLAALDSSVLFSLPFGIDAAVVILAARAGQSFWLYPLLADAGSLLGAAVTFWMGVKVGEAGLERYIAPPRLKKVRARVRTKGAVALAVLDLIPPPFPFTPFILVSGALKVSRKKFFGTLAIVRLVRFGGEAILAQVYGQSIIVWMESPTVQTIVTIAIIGAILGGAYSAIALFRRRAS
jgi:membrane protein YqaA with SNARE-associated domain